MVEEILFADVILWALNDSDGAKVSELVNITGFTEDNVRKILRYLTKRKYVRMPLFITSTGDSDPIPEGDYELSIKGKEIIASGLSVQEIVKAELQGGSHVSNNTHITGNQNQVAQNVGDDSLIAQSQDNTQITILNQMIDDDPELNSEKKSKLKEIVGKVKAMKDAGETAGEIYEWVKKGAGISAKYGPYLLALLA